MLCACAGSGIHLEGKLPLLSGLLWVVLSALTTGINEAWYLDHGVCHSHVLAGCHDSDNNHARSCDHDTEMCVCVCVCARVCACVTWYLQESATHVLSSPTGPCIIHMIRSLVCLLPSCSSISEVSDHIPRSETCISTFIKCRLVA